MSLFFVLEPQHVASIWPPAGIALGMLLVTPTRAWPTVLAGVAAAVAWANLVAGVPGSMTSGFVIANTAEPLLAAWALRRAGFVSLATLRDVGLLFAVGALGAPAVSAAIGALSAALGTGAPFLPTYVTWLLADAGGVLAVAPLILLHRDRPRLGAGWRSAIEAAVVALLVVGLTSAAFLPIPIGMQLAATPIFLFLVLAAVRFGVAGAALSTFAAAVIAAAGTIAGHGPLVVLNPHTSVQIAQVQILVATGYLISFVTAATIAERRAAATALTVRAATNERIATFAHTIAQTLEPETAFGEIARAAVDVLPADLATLSVAGGPGGGHRIVGALGAPALIGRSVEVGDGVIGRVMRDETAFVADRVEPHERAATTRDVISDRPLAMACVPIMTDGSVTATLGVARLDLANPFTAEEVRALELMADLAAIALRNAVAYATAHDLSIRDQLTGLANRRYFTTVFDQLAAIRERQDDHARSVVSAVLFDLDHFGTVNKERGHATGDRVLTAFGQLLASRLRRADVVARYGGEEFVAILVGTGSDDAVRVADEIRSSFGRMVLAGEDGESVRCTVSAGVSTIAGEVSSLATLLSTADVALSMAKRAGRNMVAAA